MKILYYFIFSILSSISLSQNYVENKNRMKAFEANDLPIIDGEVINDPAWKSILSASGFVQQSPDEGKSATEKTEVKIMFSDKNMYLAVICYHNDPENIMILDARRDSPLDDMDSFIFIIDTFNDNQNGYAFGTNAAGIEYDAQITKGGEGGSMSRRFSAGAVGGYNINWDASWSVKSLIGDFGWSAEFVIPLKTLRYSSKPDQLWGINFQRVISSNQEKAHWSQISRQFTVNRLISAGKLEGVKIPLSKSIKFIPYALGQVNSVNDSSKTNSNDNDLGFDGKINLGSALTLDFTYNTDFAQAEADEQQINLDRFSLFFPEKRAFFLENAGLFSIGESTRGGSELSMFFSRRIGIDEIGQQIPITAGGRLTGTFSDMRVGLLSMSTKSEDFSIVRLKKEMPNRTFFGGMVTNLNDLSTSGYSNQVYALDGQLGIGEISQIDGFMAISKTPNLSNDKAYSYRLSASRSAQAVQTVMSYTEIGENFNPEMGFLKRSGGYRKWSGRIFTRLRPDNSFGVLEVRPHINYDGFWKLDGFHQSGRWHIDNHLQFRSGYEIHTGVNLTKEGLTENFDIYPSKNITVPASTYDHVEAQLYFTTPSTDRISFSVMSYIGGFFGGDRIKSTPKIRMSFGDKFNSEFSYNYNQVKLPQGSFETYLSRARLTYAFSPSMYLQALLQYNNQSGVSSINWRFTIQQSAGSGLYLVYNQTEDYDGIPIESKSRSFILKYSQLFDLR
ncbi:MAG: DUF5916 domain-containing protein [Candidatus Neomarinimicrobiota bacterium]|nr:DUF5916 domain-containing protein [Candidatus Neomarinimicrobiota bacterium]